MGSHVGHVRDMPSLHHLVFHVHSSRQSLAAELHNNPDARSSRQSLHAGRVLPDSADARGLAHTISLRPLRIAQPQPTCDGAGVGAVDSAPDAPDLDAAAAATDASDVPTISRSGTPALGLISLPIIGQLHDLSVAGGQGGPTRAASVNTSLDQQPELNLRVRPQSTGDLQLGHSQLGAAEGSAWMHSTQNVTSLLAGHTDFG